VLRKTGEAGEEAGEEMKRRKVRRSRRPSTELFFDFNVKAISEKAAVRRAVVENVFFLGEWHNPEVRPNPLLKPPRSKRRQCRPRVIWLPIEATIEIDAYLTDQVPNKFRKRTVMITRPGEALAQAALMYKKLYAADAKLGGLTAEETTKRHPGRAFPLNRGFGPYIWGHDIGDLVFEGMIVRWTGPRKCSIKFHIGS
jgi:hypothetical protein